MYANRVLSGMRPTGHLHLGHYHGVLKNWVRLQHEYECFFFIADWHALTTHYDEPQTIERHVWDMVVDWLAAGVDPAQATLFIQSRVPEHAELHLLLSMITPTGWLERVPTYKDQQEKLTDKDLSTYGFLGYPLLQSADILIYRANQVPVGEDQVPHIEFTREIARRFNHIFGREPGFEERAEQAVKKLGARRAKLYRQLRTKYLEQGDTQALDSARALLEETQNLTLGDRERLLRIYRRRRQSDPDRAAGAAHRSLEDAGARRPENVEVVSQHDHAARGRRQRGQKNQDHAHRSGAREAHRSRRSGEMPGVAVAPRVFERPDAGTGCSRAAGAPASAASNASSR